MRTNRLVEPNRWRHKRHTKPAEPQEKGGIRVGSRLFPA